MTQQEAIDTRELLVAEQRKLRHGITVLKSDTITPCAGVSLAISQYTRRIEQIDRDIRELADLYSIEITPAQQPAEQPAEQATSEIPVTFETPAPERRVEAVRPDAPVEETTASVSEERVEPATGKTEATADALIALLRQLGLAR
jgi:hypothetical protein